MTLEKRGRKQSTLTKERNLELNLQALNVMSVVKRDIGLPSALPESTRTHLSLKYLLILLLNNYSPQEYMKLANAHSIEEVTKFIFLSFRHYSSSISSIPNDILWTSSSFLLFILLLSHYVPGWETYTEITKTCLFLGKYLCTCIVHKVSIV